MEVTDIEFVKPVFPVEDLTVSDSESVADNDEKPEVDEEPKEEAEVKGHDESVDVTSVTINDSKDDSQGKLHTILNHSLVSQYPLCISFPKSFF